MRIAARILYIVGIVTSAIIIFIYAFIMLFGKYLDAYTEILFSALGINAYSYLLSLLFNALNLSKYVRYITLFNYVLSLIFSSIALGGLNKNNPSNTYFVLGIVAGVIGPVFSLIAGILSAVYVNNQKKIEANRG